MNDGGIMPTPAPRGVEVAHLDSAIESSLRIQSIQELQASGATHFRTFRRSDLLQSLLQTIEAFVVDRLRHAEASMGEVLQQREDDARADGKHRVLNSLIDLGDLIDAMIGSLKQDGLSGPAKAIDKRLDRIMKTHGFERIATVGEAFDGEFHELVEEEVSPDLAPGEILREIGRGYHRRGYLLRAARVCVAVKPSKEA